LFMFKFMFCTLFFLKLMSKIFLGSPAPVDFEIP
jgi:hypothetical protein